jgi:hypothetical protein
MPLRGFGLQTVTGTAQPIFGTTLSAASIVNPDQYTGATDPRSNPSHSLVTVTNPLVFQRGDRIGIGTAANFGFPGTVTTTADWGKVVNVNYSTDVVTVQGLQRAHASGEFAVLGTDCAVIFVQAQTDPLYIGSDSSVAETGLSSLAFIIDAAMVTAGTPFQVGVSSDGNVHDTASYWAIGTAAGTFLPSIVTI